MHLFNRTFEGAAAVAKQKDLMRGILAGMAGGLVAAWMMNQFIAGPGQNLQQAVGGEPELPITGEPAPSGEPAEDATMKAAAAITEAVTGDHLTQLEKATAGPLVHYAFGVLTGGVYGGLAEYSSAVTSGFGTSFGGALFSSADLLAVPALGLGPWPTQQPGGAQATPFAAHVVYGITTELVRRLVRAIL